MLGVDQIRRYRWAEEDTNLAWTVAVAQGSTPEQLVSLYGADPTSRTELNFAEALDERNEHFDDLFVVQVFAPDEHHVVAIEPNGWLGKRPSLAEQASKPAGHFMAVYWSLNGNYQVTEAQAGRLVAHFDPLTVQQPVPLGETYPSWLDDVLLGEDQLNAVLLATLETRTGLAFKRQWLEQKLPTYHAGRGPT